MCNKALVSMQVATGIAPNWHQVGGGQEHLQVQHGGSGKAVVCSRHMLRLIIHDCNSALPHRLQLGAGIAGRTSWGASLHGRR